MTTVIDPAGSPVAIFNRTGTAIVDMAINVGPGEPIVPIPHYAGQTIARVLATSTGSPGNGGIELPANAEIGDKVEIAPDLASTANVPLYAPSGENIDGQASVTVGTYLWLRKISATDWRRR